MAERKTVIIDAGHGGANPGAVYMGRQEKDDALRLALAVGNLLEQSGVNVLYTRVNDVFDTPLEKAISPVRITLSLSTATPCRFPAARPGRRCWCTRTRAFRLFWPRISAGT